MDISFELLILSITLITSFCFLFLKNNSVDALHNYIFNLTSNNLQVYLLLGIIILILLFNIKIL